MAAIQAEIGLIDARVARAAEHHEPILDGEVKRLQGGRFRAAAACGEAVRRAREVERGKPKDQRGPGYERPPYRAPAIGEEVIDHAEPDARAIPFVD